VRLPKGVPPPPPILFYPKCSIQGS
jgi:hypothetical protein